MEQLISIKYISNLINLNESSNKISITQLEILKHKILFLLNTNSILFYDTKTEKFFKKKFDLNDQIILLKVYNDQIFIIIDKQLKLLDQVTLDEARSWEIGETFYSFCPFEDFNNFNLEIIYSNYQNELKYYSKAYLFEPKYKNLYKESNKIDTVIYKKGILIWCSNWTIRAFDLEKKKMVMRKNYENLEKNEKLSENEFLQFLPKIDFLYFDGYLCINIKQKFIIIYKLFSDNEGLDNSNSNESFSSTLNNSQRYQSQEIFRLDCLKENSNIIGFWLNSSLTKISVIKNNINNENSINNLKLEIYKLNTNETDEQIETIHKNLNSNQLIHQKNFKHIISENKFIFAFCQKYSTVFLHDGHEIWHITLVDKTEKLFDDFKNNKNYIQNFNEIYSVFNKLTSLSEKFYIVNKIIRNLNSLYNNKQIDQSKLLYLINSIITSSISHDLNYVILNHITNLLIKVDLFEQCYTWINKHFNGLNKSSELFEKIILYLLDKKNYEILIKFLTEQENLKISRESDDTLNDLASDIVTGNKELMHIYALVSLKQNDYKKSVEFLLKINKIEEIYQILIKNSCENLIFDFDNLITKFNTEQLIQILDNFNKFDNNENILNLYKLILSNHNEKIGFDLFIKIITEEKYYLIINHEIAEEIFDIILLNENNNYVKLDLEYVNCLTKLIINCDKIDCKKIIEKNENILNKNLKLIEVYILLLIKINNYIKVVEIYITTLRDPEKAMNFIENLSNITDTLKEDLYKFLKNKIKEANFLSSAKKFYFINTFEDNVLEENQEIRLLEEITQSEEDEDLKFILLILEQLKLKIRILDISKNLSCNHLDKITKEFKRETNKGKSVIINKILNCQYSYCDNKRFQSLDNVVCFVNCMHFFHKFCFDKMNENTSTKHDDIESTDNKLSLLKIIKECKICSKTR